MAASVPLRKVPASHAAGIGTTLPLGQLKPAAHSLPGGVGLVDPDGQRYPGEQELQDTAPPPL